MKPENRVSVLLKDENSRPVTDVKVELVQNQKTIWVSRTDNDGKAELWINLFEGEAINSTSGFSLKIDDGKATRSNIKLFESGINEIRVNYTPSFADDKIEIAFVVDATGSMADELEYLKAELEDVIKKVEKTNPQTQVMTGAVFYRDEGDDYVTKTSPFDNGIGTTISFIREQSADGGGNFPEAVHSAMSKAVNELQWSSSARSRVIFLVLDAPPHYEDQVIADLKNSIQKAAELGIKVIPISASGIDKETEFLLRTMGIVSNGTYVFITDHSGIGNDHLEPTIGQYKVEYLNELLVRLINKQIE